MLKRSDVGRAPTPDELELLAQLDIARIGEPMAQWAEIAKRHGLDVVFAILDEFHGEKIYIPCRRSFVDVLWRPARDALAHRMHFIDGKGPSAVAAALGITRQCATSILSSRRADTDASGVVKGRS